ncbi:DUF2304 family protein [Candidatus Uhrbacteria bacterium]|nr:DUF2304 family protein [Candidatus Uhrbacteria bacterium]
MSNHPIQFFILAFVGFAVSRVVSRYREGKLQTAPMIGWAAFWLATGVVSLLPQVATVFARIVGVGRGVDAVMYVAILGLFYGLFRMFVRVEQLEHQLTLIVRAMALKDRAGRSKQEPTAPDAGAPIKAYAEQESRGHHRVL